MNKQASPVTVIVAIVVPVLVVGGLWHKFVGPFSQPSAPPETIPGNTRQTGGASSATAEEGRPKLGGPEGAPTMTAASLLRTATPRLSIGRTTTVRDDTTRTRGDKRRIAARSPVRERMGCAPPSPVNGAEAPSKGNWVSVSKV